MISINGRKFRCVKCNNISTANDINNNTLNKCCKNRKQRKQFVPVENADKADPYWYVCPVCDSYIIRVGWKDIADKHSKKGSGGR